MANRAYLEVIMVQVGKKQHAYFSEIPESELI